MPNLQNTTSLTPTTSLEDIITKINDYKVDTFEDLMSYLALNTEPGDIVKIEVVRDYKYLNLEVNLEARPD